ncbi:hypothetical protein [Plantibacter sp. RU18]|uniref:hypothetical protein n=1 Tax=Plantibacter sp. RU18 TaxID=3158143 RepID=UPI003D35A38B
MFTTTTTRPRRRTAARFAVLLALPLLVGSLAACSGNTPDPKSSSGAEQTFEDWQVDFASCMRGEGVDMPDPGKDGSSAALRIDEENAEAFQTASDTCIERLGEPPAPPEGTKTEAEFFEEQLKMAECFRENGIDTPDPVKGQGMTIPADVPEDVLEACGLPAGMTSGGATVTR